MILYYRKVTLITLDFREELEREEKLAWCQVDSCRPGEFYHGHYESGTFAEAEARILACYEDPKFGDHIGLTQLPKVTAHQNLNPHGLS